MVEADLAVRGVDLRDLARPVDSRLTLRRVRLLIEALPAEALLWAAIKAAEAESLRPKVEDIRARQDRWKRPRAQSA